jgi:hypothetical protein
MWGTAAIAIVLLVPACSSVGDSVQGILAPITGTSSDPRDVTTPDPNVSPRPAFAATAGVEIRRRAAADSEVVGELTRYQPVRRHQVVAGFVFVTGDGIARSGWVKEHELLERRPAPSRPAARSKSTAPTVAPSEAPSTDVPGAPGDTPGEAPAEPPVQPRERSVFDPY